MSGNTTAAPIQIPNLGPAVLPLTAADMLIVAQAGIARRTPATFQTLMQVLALLDTLPTTTSGLQTGDWWIDGGTLKRVL